MNATFSLDGCHRLEIGEDAPRVCGDARSVHIQLNHTMLRPLSAGERHDAIPAGTIVHINGVPFELTMNASAISHDKNWELAGMGSTVPRLNGGFPFVCGNGEQVVFAAGLRPSHARAIASAMLSAATEARE